MRCILQRVTHSEVEIDQKINGAIKDGYMILVGFEASDTNEVVDKMINKIIHLRVFEDENHKMNKSLLDVNGSILSISQFTLYASCKNGRRPSFTDAAKPDVAIPLYDYFNETLRNQNIVVETGIFGADMKVTLLNDGPITIILDSDELF